MQSAEQQDAPTLIRKSSLGTSVRDVLSKRQPTNKNMLVLRTLNFDLGHPDANNDWVAALFRDKLLPLRHRLPAFKRLTYRCVEHEEHGTPGVCNFLDARTKLFDDQMKGALDDGILQVVVLAAGYCSRAYRFHRPGVDFFEIDLPEVSRMKQALVSKALPKGMPRPTYIGADLAVTSVPHALGATKYDPSKPTLFTIEGVIYYLPSAAADTMLSSIVSVAAPGSLVVMDYLHSDALNGSKCYRSYDTTAHCCALKNEPFLSGFNNDPHALAEALAAEGLLLEKAWSPKELLAEKLPHVKWSDSEPPILPFYSYCSARVPGSFKTKIEAVDDHIVRLQAVVRLR